MKMIIRMTVASVIAAGLYGCAQFAGVSSLRGAEVTVADQVAELKPYAGKRPGSGQPIARTFKEQPPLVPHAMDNFDEITVSDNQCMECHSPATAPTKQAPKVADSHLSGAALRMERYQCNNCHVPQVDAKPLVPTNFVGTPVPVRK